MVKVELKDGSIIEVEEGKNILDGRDSYVQWCD